MSPSQQRLKFHQIYSGSLMEKLKDWLTEQFDQRKVEPNSSLGKAISYMLKHSGWLIINHCDGGNHSRKRWGVPLSEKIG